MLEPIQRGTNQNPLDYEVKTFDNRYPDKETSDELLENFEISKVHLGLNFNPKEDAGFEPARRFRPDSFQDCSLQPNLGNLP